MELNKEKWCKQDKIEFIKYLKTFAKPEKEEWTRRIINTKMPLLAIPTPKIKEIAKEIGKGNFIEFLNLDITDFYENLLINGFLICKIKDFALFKRYLLKHLDKVDNWANCDQLPFKNLAKNNGEELFELSKQLIKSDKTFVRRVGEKIWLEYIDSKKIDEIFSIINYKEENEYYVNMCVAWLISECFIKQRDKTLKFLQINNLNKFTINKAISKCRDSFRITKQDKEMLLKYKKI